MQLTPTGDTIMLVVRLQPDDDGTWHLHLEGLEPELVLPLAPATLIVQLWRDSGSKLLRGTLRLHGTAHSATIQSNTQLIDLLRSWLMDVQ
ncbi:MAG: hypothetical protein HGA45_29065 [Chloroflexales bacterium]|nr:hypothetical protein [Chloroflexales bacterium]